MSSPSLAKSLATLKRALVVEEVVADPEGGVISPLVRIADLGDEGVALLQGPPLRLVPHPVERADRLAVGLQEVVDEAQHPLLVGRREVPGDVLFADSLAEGPLDEAHAPLPPLALFDGSAQHPPVEVEVGVVDLLGEVGGAGLQDPPAGIGLQVLQRGAVPQSGGGGDRIGVRDDRIGHPLERGSGRFERRVPRESWGAVEEVRPREGVVDLVDVAGVDDAHVRCGDFPLHGEDHAGLRRCGLLVQAVAEGQQTRHEGLVLGEHAGVPGVAVVGLVRQADARLGDEDRVAGGVVEIGGDFVGEEGVHARRRQSADRARELLAVRGRLDRRQIRLQRCGSLGVEGVDVHPAVEQPSDLPGLALGGVGRREFLDDLADLLLGLKRQGGERAVGGQIRGNLVRVDPRAVDGAEEIVLNADRGICALQNPGQGVVRNRHGAKLTQVPEAGGTWPVPWRPCAYTLRRTTQGSN